MPHMEHDLGGYDCYRRSRSFPLGSEASIHFPSDDTPLPDWPELWRHLDGELSILIPPDTHFSIWGVVADFPLYGAEGGDR